MKNPILKAAVMFLILLSVSVIFAFAVGAAAEDMNVIATSVVADGEPVLTDGAGALLCDGVTYVPLRAFCNLMGDCEIEWNAGTRSASVRSVGLEISARDGDRYMLVNDRAFYCPRGIFLRFGVLYVPVRVIAAAYGASVEWKSTDDARLGYVNMTTGGGRAEKASDVYDDDVLYWLSRIISAESRGESLEGQIAVGNVVLNRMRSSEFPDTVYDVIFDKKFGVQFTPVSNGTVYDDPAPMSVIAAKICLEGYSLSDSIIYFLNEAASTNFWVPNNRDYVMTIGCHDFYS